MRNLDIFSVAEHCVLSKIALFEVQEAPIVANTYEVSASKFFPGVLEKGELVKT